HSMLRIWACDIPKKGLLASPISILLHMWVRPAGFYLQVDANPVFSRETALQRHWAEEMRQQPRLVLSRNPGERVIILQLARGRTVEEAARDLRESGIHISAHRPEGQASSRMVFSCSRIWEITRANLRRRK
ncbi:hypothetical protein, partial [Thiolapillus sp.]